MLLRRRLIVLAALVPALAACSGSHSACRGGAATPACTRVLFIGNSYTYVNDLPEMFARLAASGHHSVATGMLATGGGTLAEHEGDPATSTMLASEHWNFVVLQEQSEIPSVASLREAEMVPAALQLVQSIRAAGAQPLLFLTWAHRDGWPENQLPTYASMQQAVDDGYLELASEENAAVAPVGYAWWTLVADHPRSDLWEADGSHPSTAGTYLAASVFYATIFQQSPEGLGFHAGLPADEAAREQQIAGDVVLGRQAMWHLG